MTMGNGDIFIQLTYKSAPIPIRLGGESHQGLHPRDIPRKGILIGRQEDCPWRIPPTDKTASGHHAILTRTLLGQLVLKDMGSHNGILYHGEKVLEVVLKPGDSCNLGDATLVVKQDTVEKKVTEKQILPRLVQLNGQGKGTVYQIEKKKAIIGSFRTPGQEKLDEQTMMIVCSHPSVSSHHAVIWATGQSEGYRIADSGSTNHTSVNGQRLDASKKEGRLLQERDEILVGTVRFRFYLKTQDSNGFKKIMAGLITLVVVCAIWVVAALLTHTAPWYLEHATQLADNEQYDTALRMLNKGKNARHASRYIQDISDKERQIDTWQKTRKRWEFVKKSLSEKKFRESNKALAPLMSERIELLWGGQTEHARKEKEHAVIVDRLLSAILQAGNKMDEGMTVSEDTVEDQDFKNRREDLQKIITSLPSDMPDYMAPLKAEALQTVQELAIMEGQHNKLAEMFFNLRRTRNIAKADEACLRLHEQVNVHVQERVNGKLPAYRGVLEALERYQKPLGQLHLAEDVYRQNLAAVMNLDFKLLKEPIPLPSQQQTSILALFSELRKELEEQNKTLLKRSGQIRTSMSMLTKDGNATGKRSPAITALLDNSLWESALECAFLKAPKCQWTSNRKTPVSDYDRLFGIEIFWEYLTGLSEEIVPFDQGLLSDRDFLPSLFQAKVQYMHLEQFRDMMTSKPFEDLLKSSIENNSKLYKLTQWANTLLDERARKLVKEKMDRSRQETNVRKSLILGGAALVLADSDQMVVYQRDYVRLQLQLRDLRKNLEQMLDADETVEERDKSLEEILDKGLPGDSNVGNALKELGRWK